LLTFDKRFEDGVPHDRPEVVHEFLRKRFGEYIAAHPGELRERQNPQRSLAGRASGATTRSLTPAQWLNDQVAVAEELLWHKTCSQCHAISATALQDVKIARWDAAGLPRGVTPASSDGAMAVNGQPPRIDAAHTVLQWLPHARFDHDAHAGFSCTGCHQKALRSTETSDILVPGIAVCQTCHAPGPGHAESRCSECHTYHDWSKRKEVKPTFTLPALRGGGQ
jgi:ribosomal protein L40E